MIDRADGALESSGLLDRVLANHTLPLALAGVISGSCALAGVFLGPPVPRQT
jgi:hypothetical protein